MVKKEEKEFMIRFCLTAPHRTRQSFRNISKVYATTKVKGTRYNTICTVHRISLLENKADK